MLTLTNNTNTNTNKTINKTINKAIYVTCILCDKQILVQKNEHRCDIRKISS